MEFVHSFLVILFVTRLVNSTVERRECTPSDDVNCSSLFGYGRFEEIVKDSAEDISTSASINCQIEGKEDLLKVEWILVGEPPRTVEFEADTEVLSTLHGLTLTCIVSDIPLINRAPPPSAEQPYQIGIGNVTYNCDGSGNLSIKFIDMRMLSRDLRKMTGGLGAGNGMECVSEAKMPEGETSDQLGQACAGRLRYMYDETGQFVCEQCCANHYWSKEYCRGQCRECSACFSNDDPNIWTSCKTVKDCTSTSTAPSIPHSTTTVLTPPSLSPQNVKIAYRNQTYADVKWDAMASSPVDQYIVTTSMNEQHKSWQTLTNYTAVGIPDLSPFTSYAIAICGSNKAGRGPWSEPVHFKTLGMKPRHPPTNVVVSRIQDRVSVTWDPIVGQQTGDEDPILGVKVHFRALQNGSDNGILIDSHEESLEFLLKEYGTYEILVYSYNEAGESPAEEHTEEYMEVVKTSNTGLIVGVVIGTILLLLVIAALVLLLVTAALVYWFCIRKREKYFGPYNAKKITRQTDDDEGGWSISSRRPLIQPANESLNKNAPPGPTQPPPHDDEEVGSNYSQSDVEEFTEGHDVDLNSPQTGEEEDDLPTTAIVNKNSVNFQKSTLRTVRQSSDI